MIESNDKTFKLPPINHRHTPPINDTSKIQKIFKETLKDPVSRIQTSFSWAKIKPLFLAPHDKAIVDLDSSIKEDLSNWIQTERDLNILNDKKTVADAVLLCLNNLDARLKIQNLDHLSELPNFIFNIPIRELEIYNCNKINTIDLSNPTLKNLQKLSIKGCLNLTKIPNEIGDLSCLRFLALIDLPSIKELNPQIFSLQGITSLHIIRCTQIKHIPEEISLLKNIEILSFEGCSELQNITPSIGFLPKLYYLNLSNCTQITSLPETLKHLKSLKTLIAFRCLMLKTLPEDLNFCTKLMHVLLNECYMLNSIPRSWCFLSKNCVISVENCPIALNSVVDLERSILLLHKNNSIFGPNLPLSFQKAKKSELDSVLKIYYWKFKRIFTEKNLRMLNFEFFRFQIKPEETQLLKKFLMELFNTSEYQNEKTQDNLLKIVFQILEKSASDPFFFQEKAIFLIFAALSSCEDQLLVGLNRIHLELKIHNLSSSPSIEKSYNLLIGYRRLQLLYQEVKNLHASLPKVDFVELFLFLQILLSDCLKLPSETKTMAYQLDPQIPIKDIAKLIKENILEKTESKKQIIDVLCIPQEKIYDESGKLLKSGDLTLDNPFYLELSDLWIEQLLKFFPDCCNDLQISDTDLMQTEKLLQFQRAKTQRFKEITSKILQS